MAEQPEIDLVFGKGCPDCGERVVSLPPPLPRIADDFDWQTRDYDSFRLFMMEELAHRFPERRRWTAADMEVVIVEALAAALDRLSHALDTIQAERFLETARRPGSVRRLLAMIGHDPARDIDPAALAAVLPDNGQPHLTARRVERYWQLHPSAMEEARARGPERIRAQARMVTLADHEARLIAHPLVSRARARLVWSGAWTTVLVSVLLEGGLMLDDELLGDPTSPTEAGRKGIDPELREATTAFHRAEGLAVLPFTAQLTGRQVLRVLVEQRRLAGSEVFLEDASEVPIAFTLSIRAKPGYFRSELKTALTQAFDADSGGLFEPGNLGFGDDVFASDIIAAAMAVEGVETACLNLFKRAGGQSPDRSGAGFIPIGEDEIAACLNRSGAPERGSFRIVVNGGQVG